MAENLIAVHLRGNGVDEVGTHLSSLVGKPAGRLGAQSASPEGQATAADLANFATGGVTLMIADVQDLASR
jgi:hypothetical protein